MQRNRTDDVKPAAGPARDEDAEDHRQADSPPIFLTARELQARVPGKAERETNSGEDDGDSPRKVKVRKTD